MAVPGEADQQGSGEGGAMASGEQQAVHDKVYAYITQADQVLVFRHVDFPEAGIQVPGGTVESGEPLREAVLREAFEETGIADLEIVAELGDTWPVMDDDRASEVRHRHFFHLSAATPLPATWQHEERDPYGGGSPIRFEYFWIPLAGADAQLIAELGALVHRIGGQPGG